MARKKVLGTVTELILLFMIFIVGIKVFSGNPAEASYNDYVMVPFIYIYLGLYALKIFVNRSASNLKYMFYAAFGILILGIRFYVDIDLVDSVKYISLGAIVVLVVYHIIEILKLFKKVETIDAQ
jgi:uncharacterized membrane protein